jgi:hypothetical protein
VGCGDSLPGRHATAPLPAIRPLIRSYEPGEGWYWCSPDAIALELDGAPPAPVRA